MVCKNCGKKVFAKETCQCGEKAPNVHGAGVALNSVICTILLALSVIFIILTMSLRNIVNNNILIDTVKNIDLCEVQVEDESGKAVKLDQYIYDNYIDDERITVSNVDNVLSDPFIKDFVIEKLEGYQAFFMDEGDIVYITSDDIVNLIDENSELLYNEAGLRFLEPDKQQLKDDLSGLDKFSQFSEDYLTGWFSSGLIHTFFSFANVIFLAVLMAVIFIQWIVVYKLNARRAGKVFRKYGIAMIVPSAVILISSVSLIFLNKEGIVNALVTDIKWSFTIASVNILGIGIALLAISVPMCMKKNKAQYSVPSQPEENTVQTEMSAQPAYAAAPQPAATEIPAADSSDSAAAAPATAPESENIVVSESTGKQTGICPQCGYQNKEASSFCSRCGTKLK
ncbi:zinc ribbon domain-containing protein [Porcipelethomonas sp.]|uniref:zinc ribbon domain-containing protein n=1 Tax=Porcipelethomonas sp. TaxID=2981675 RepID=UPI003EFB32E7